MIVVRGFSFDRRLREAERALGPLKTILPLEVNEIITQGAARAFYLRAGLLHRTADIASSAIESYSRWRLMPAFLMTRAVLETVAVYYCLYQETEEGVGSQDTGEAGRRVEAFVSGSNGHNYKDPQSADILAAVDRLEPVVRDVRADYDQLNTIALPSWGGTFEYYSAMHSDRIGVWFDSSHCWLDVDRGPWLLANLLNAVVTVDGSFVNVLGKIACPLDKSARNERSVDGPPGGTSVQN